MNFLTMRKKKPNSPTRKTWKDWPVMCVVENSMKTDLIAIWMPAESPKPSRRNGSVAESEKRMSRRRNPSQKPKRNQINGVSSTQTFSRL